VNLHNAFLHARTEVHRGSQTDLSLLAASDLWDHVMTQFTLLCAWFSHTCLYTELTWVWNHIRNSWNVTFSWHNVNRYLISFRCQSQPHKTSTHLCFNSGEVIHDHNILIYTLFRSSIWNDVHDESTWINCRNACYYSFLKWISPHPFAKGCTWGYKKQWFCQLLCIGMKRGLLLYGRNVGCKFLRAKYSGKYLELRSMKPARN
jgi:hypothetical protein